MLRIEECSGIADPTIWSGFFVRSEGGAGNRVRPRPDWSSGVVTPDDSDGDRKWFAHPVPAEDGSLRGDERNGGTAHAELGRR